MKRLIGKGIIGIVSAGVLASQTGCSIFSPIPALFHPTEETPVFRGESRESNGYIVRAKEYPSGKQQIEIYGRTNEGKVEQLKAEDADGNGPEPFLIGDVHDYGGAIRNYQSPQRLAKIFEEVRAKK